MMNNVDVVRMLAEIKEFCDTDRHGGALHFARTKMVEMKFFDTMPESGFDPFRPCPTEWTAFQLAIFDNGPVEPAKRKRNYIERTKVRFGGNLKVWTRDEINFRNKAQVSWQSNVYLWDHDKALLIANELLAQSYVDQDTVDLIARLVELSEPTSKIAIPVLKTREGGSRWMKSHALLVTMDGEALGAVTFVGPVGLAIAGEVWSEQDASGKDLDDNVAGQMRIGRHSGFDAWATQPSV